MIYLTPRAQTWGVPPIWEGGIPYLMFVQVSVPYIFPIAGFLRWLKCKLTVDHMTYAWATRLARGLMHVREPMLVSLCAQKSTING